jgi:hypothetical protein
MRFNSQLFFLIGSLTLLKPLSPDATAAATVNVILWFDTEDYLLPADDDAAKRLAEMLTARGIRATFKVVGEKARVLERRGRSDVIAALQKHAIGYHANFHSVHPTPTEYLADCGWLVGVAEFVRREGGGAADVRRIFSVPSLVCYGQPGSSWAPQAIGALKEIGVANGGIPCYVDEGTHVGLGEQPFWYAGALVVYHMGENCTRMDLHDPAAVEPAKQRVAEIVDRLGRREGGGLISIFYHPCEWVHKEFWDGVNFSRGANPPREQWKPPPQRPPEETEAAFQRFGQYIDYIQSFPNVHFITAGDLPGVYPDPVRSDGTPETDLTAMSLSLMAGAAFGVDFQVIGHRAYSLADQFELLTRAVGALSAGEALQFPLHSKGLLGPDSPPPPSFPTMHLAWPVFRDTTRDVLDFIETQGRVPSRVFIGPDPIPPGEYLIALAAVFESYRTKEKLPIEEGVTISNAPELLPAARNIAEDTPNLFGDWIIHKEGFRAPKVMEQARLQAWTLKPALPKR